MIKFQIASLNLSNFKQSQVRSTTQYENYDVQHHASFTHKLMYILAWGCEHLISVVWQQ